MIHLEGMGVVGSILAWRLAEAGKRFTWDDTNAPHTAWKACTGVIYPSGNSFDQRNYDVWQLWAHRPPWYKKISLCTELSNWWYCTASAPHGAKIPVGLDLGVLRRSSAFAFHLNAQQFVQETRLFFRSQRFMGAPRASSYIVTHGFGARLDHVLWGWTAAVKLQFDRRMADAYRSSIYCRQGRYVMAYAYCTPGSDTWYAGSSLIVQKSPKSLDIGAKVMRWKETFERLTGGLVKVLDIGRTQEGWRPAASKTDTALVRTINDKLYLMPLWSSGVRHAPLVTAAVMELL